MSLISEKCLKDFNIWAKKNEDKDIFQQIDKDKDSYYINKNAQREYLMEYSFVNMAGLKQAIEVYSGLASDSQMLDRLVVELSQGRSNCKTQTGKESQKHRVSEQASQNRMYERMIEDFTEWAEENGDNNIFPDISNDEDSYYISRETEETYLMEYTFQNMAWLKEALQKYSGLSPDSQILKELAVKICQNKSSNNLEIRRSTFDRERREEVEENKKILPEFIYVF